MLPDPGELERLLGLEARIQSKIVAASVYGMGSEVIEGTIAGDLRAYADRLASGDEELLDEGETESGAFVGEQLRRLIDRAVREGEAKRVLRLPWGVGVDCVAGRKRRSALVEARAARAGRRACLHGIG